MTFATDVARNLFHRLPTDVQVKYSRLEEHLAMDGKMLHVECVQQHEGRLEVLVRISEKLQKNAIFVGPGG